MEFLHPAMWHDHDIDFVRWLHPVVWHAALESWQWIHQVAAPCNVTRGCGMTCHWIHPNVRHWNSTYGFHFHTSPQSTCHSVPVCEILSKLDHSRKKKMTSCRFSRWQISAILDCRDPIIGSLKSLCTTSYRSSIATIALNCLVFAFWRQTDKLTDGQTDGQLRSTKPLSLSRAVT